jgi:radical SAM-linked protein
MSLVSPLPLGYTGEREILEITLKETLPPDEVLIRLQASVPEGIAIRDVVEVPAEGKSAASKLVSAAYDVQLSEPVPDLAERLARLLESPTIEIEEDRDGKIRRRDIRPALLSLEADGDQCFHLTAAYDGGTVRPEQILDLLSLPRDGAQVTRTHINVASSA